MGVNGKQSSTVIFHDLSVVVESPRGCEIDGHARLRALYGDSFAAHLQHEYPMIAESDGEPFNGDNLCEGCGTPYNSDAHRSFIFYLSPADIQHAAPMGGVPSEWRPCPDSRAIPGDRGPNRVAYWYENAPVVQVHDGDDHGFWVPCYSYTVTRDALPYSMWICRRGHVGDPCDEDYLRSISS